MIKRAFSSSIDAASEIKEKAQKGNEEHKSPLSSKIYHSINSDSIGGIAETSKSEKPLSSTPYSYKQSTPCGIDIVTNEDERNVSKETSNITTTVQQEAPQRFLAYSIPSVEVRESLQIPTRYVTSSFMESPIIRPGPNYFPLRVIETSYPHTVTSDSVKEFQTDRFAPTSTPFKEVSLPLYSKYPLHLISPFSNTPVPVVLPEQPSHTNSIPSHINISRSTRTIGSPCNSEFKSHGVATSQQDANKATFFYKENASDLKIINEEYLLNKPEDNTNKDDMDKVSDDKQASKSPDSQDILIEDNSVLKETVTHEMNSDEECPSISVHSQGTLNVSHENHKLETAAPVLNSSNTLNGPEDKSSASYVILSSTPISSQHSTHSHPHFIEGTRSEYSNDDKNKLTECSKIHRVEDKLQHTINNNINKTETQHVLIANDEEIEQYDSNRYMNRYVYSRPHNDQPIYYMYPHSPAIRSADLSEMRTNEMEITQPSWIHTPFIPQRYSQPSPIISQRSMIDPSWLVREQTREFYRERSPRFEHSQSTSAREIAQMNAHYLVENQNNFSPRFYYLAPNTENPRRYMDVRREYVTDYRGVNPWLNREYYVSRAYDNSPVPPLPYQQSYNYYPWHREQSATDYQTTENTSAANTSSSELEVVSDFQML